jgi:opacity protein-like surface antigen
VHVIAEVGQMSDVMPSSIRDEIDEMIAEISAEGVSASLSLRAPATYAFGGVRWSGRGRVSPFVEAGGGSADISLDVEAFTIDGIDFTSTFRQFLSEEEDLETTAGMLVVSGGITAALSRVVSIDAGYRFARILTEDPAVNVSSAHVAVTFGW